MPQPEQTRADDAFGGRPPTSHERMSGVPWDASYHDGPAPWDIGRPQPAVVRLAAETGFTGSILDAGCGTGENGLHLAARGADVLGIDVADTAVARARTNARSRGIRAEFITADALRLSALARTFSAVLDCGLFHTFDEKERTQYAASLASVTRPGATLYLLAFSDEPSAGAPHSVSRDDIRHVFTPASSWTVTDLREERLETRFHEAPLPAWRATIQRT